MDIETAAYTMVSNYSYFFLYCWHVALYDRVYQHQFTFKIDSFFSSAEMESQIVA